MLSELRATLRVITQIVAIETSSTPLKYLYRCYYKLAKHFFCRQLNQIPGVSAAYCLDGKKSHPIYGLSDIDLFVVVSSHDAKKHVKNIHRKCHSLFPVLCSPDEFFVFTEEELPNELSFYPMHQYRFGSDKRHEQLVGEDLLKDLNLSASPFLRVRSRLNFFLSLLQEEHKQSVHGWPAAGLHKKRLSTLWCKFFGHLREGLLCSPLPRKEINALLARQGLDKGRLDSPSFRTSQTFSFNSGLRTAHPLVKAAFDSNKPDKGESASRKSITVRPPSYQLSDAVHDDLRRLLSDEEVDRCKLLPAIYFSPDIRGPWIKEGGVPAKQIENHPLKLCHIDNFILWVECSTLPTEAFIRHLSAIVVGLPIIEIILEFEGIGYGVFALRSPWQLCHTNTHPELFSLKSFKRFDKSIQLEIPRSRYEEILYGYKRRSELIAETLSENQIQSLSEAELYRLALHTFDCAAFTNSLESGKPELHTSKEDLLTSSVRA